MTRRPIGLTAPYRYEPKTTLVPGAPWPKDEPKKEKPKPKRKQIPNTGKRAQTDKNFNAWAEKNLPTNLKGIL